MQPLLPTELILNDDGSIYHLHLHPEQLASTVLTVGDPGRVAAVSAHFDRIEHRVHKREFITHTGYIGEKRLSVISTGIGTDNIDIVFNELDALVSVDLSTRLPKAVPGRLDIIRIGTSGSLHAGIPVDSFLVSEGGLGFDNLLHYYRYDNNADEKALLAAIGAWLTATGYPFSPYYFAADEGLLGVFRERGFATGITVTCPGFYAPQGRMIRATPLATGWLDRLRGCRPLGRSLSNFEMETSAMYGLGRILGHRTLSCNVILANRETGQFSPDPGRAVDLLIGAVLEALGC